VDLCSVVPPENFNPHNYFPAGELEAAKAAGCAQEPDAAGCAQKQEKDAEESWQGNYQLGAEDSDEEKAEQAAWADSMEKRRMAGGLGGSEPAIVDYPNNPAAVGPVRGTQMNTPQTQHHSVVPIGKVEAEMKKVVSKMQNLAASAPSWNHAGELSQERVESSAAADEARGRWRAKAQERRGRMAGSRSEKVARARAAFDGARGAHTQAAQERSQAGCGPLCQLRKFVRGNRKIAADDSV